MSTEAQRRHQQELKRKKRQDHRTEKRHQSGGNGKSSQSIGIGHSCQAAEVISTPPQPPAPVKLPPVASGGGTFGVPPDGIVEINSGYYEAKSVEALRLAELMPWRHNWVDQLSGKFLGGADWQSRERSLTVGHFTIATVELLRRDKGFTEQDLSLIAKLLLRLDLRFATCSASLDGNPRSYIQQADGWDESEWGRNMSRWLSKLIRVSADRVKKRQRKTAAMTPQPVVKEAPRRQYPKPPLPDVILGDDDHEVVTPVLEEVVPEMDMPDLYDSTGGGIIESFQIRDLAPHPLQPRTYFSPGGLKALGEDLKVRQIQPIFVTKIENLKEWIEFVSPADYEKARQQAYLEAIQGGKPRLIFRHGELDGRQFIIVDGERRWRSAEVVGLSFLWGVVTEITDADQLFLVSFFGNEHRDQLNPVDEANAFQKIVNRKLMSVVRLAERLNKSTAFIYQRLALLKLAPEVQAMMDPALPAEQRLGSYSAYLLASIKDPAKQVQYAREIISRKIGSGEVGTYLRTRAQQEGVARETRSRTPREDYRNLVRFLALTSTKTDLFLSLPVPQVKVMFRFRDPADLQAVVEKLESDVEKLSGLLRLLRSIARQNEAGGKN